MALTIDELKKGISYWRCTKWPQDFHNAFYECGLAPVRSGGVFNDEWWNRFIRILHDWRATRPCSFACLTARAQERFTTMGEKWSDAVAPHLSGDIAGLEWSQVAAFPVLVAEIKPLKRPSPVFT